ncbi:MAG TPA: tannase/feruloyl esterase family alpha/beta hydrolase, partial [Burkholderiaceae bacterium]|nr:tannase/feruloyl esterase family alpha/beta hydrolase [Burkholderiaceae bacterium]
LALGTSQPTIPMPNTAPYISQMTDQWIKYGITRDTSFNSLMLDPENPGPWANRISEMTALNDDSSDISAFVDRGGKVLIAHGVSDVLVSTRATEQYYQRLQAQFGAATVNTFARYYEVPGFGHAISTQFNATWDSLTALEQWVERDVAPSGQVTTDTAGVPGRSRPLCDYPKWPQYNGTGDVNAAASFTCVD